MALTRTISRIYIISALAAAMLLAPLPYSAMALILLSLQLYCIYKPCRADLALPLTLSTLRGS